MYFIQQNIVTAKEVEKFNSVLSEHHRAVTADGSTLVERAVIEHNLLSASALYRSVTFDNLGTILGISSQKGKVPICGNFSEKKTVRNILRIIFGGQLKILRFKKLNETHSATDRKMSK